MYVYTHEMFLKTFCYFCVFVFLFFLASLRGLTLNIDERDSKQDFP